MNTEKDDLAEVLADIRLQRHLEKVLGDGFMAWFCEQQKHNHNSLELLAEILVDIYLHQENQRNMDS